MKPRSIAEIVGLDDGLCVDAEYTVDDLLAWLLTRRWELSDAIWVQDRTYRIQFWDGGNPHGPCTEIFGGPTLLAALEAAVRAVDDAR